MDAKLILNQYDLEKIPLTWFGFNNEQGQIERKLKEAVGSRWDNGRLMFEYYGLFSLQVNRRKCHKNSPLHLRIGEHGKVKFYDETDRIGMRYTNIWEWHLWDATGNHSLGGGHFLAEPDQSMPGEIITQMTELCQDFNRDICTCCGCGKKINKDEIAGIYFAGRYCSECWESKYREIEARETYN